MKIAALTALAIALVAVWSATASIRGRSAARFDVWRGHYKILLYGLPPSWRTEYVHLLKERYGIETSTVALCIVSNGLVSYVNNYDTVISAGANEKFGHDIFRECAEEAKNNWERQHPTIVRYRTSP
jgi:hypothetical protein